MITVHHCLCLRAHWREPAAVFMPTAVVIRLFCSKKKKKSKLVLLGEHEMSLQRTGKFQKWTDKLLTLKTANYGHKNKVNV